MIYKSDFKCFEINKMPMYDFFKNLFGFPNNKYEHNDKRGNDYRNQFWNNNDNSEQFEDVWSENHEQPHDGMHFNIFTDPLEMHRYFEYQMNEMLKSFSGLFGGGGHHNDGNSFFGTLPELPHFGQQLEPPESFHQDDDSHLRNQFLKPGYEKPRHFDAYQTKPKFDSDVDGKISQNDLDALLDEKNQQLTINPYQRGSNLIGPQIRSYGRSSTNITIRGSDGSVEVHQTVRDNDGNEQTTITKHKGDKRHILTIHTDKDGRQEKTEDFINMDPNEMNTLFPGKPSASPNRFRPENPNFDGSDFNTFFPFDKFFK